MSPPAAPHRRQQDDQVNDLERRADIFDDIVQEHDTAIQAQHRAVDLLTQQMVQLRMDLERNTEVTEEIRDMVRAARAGFKVLGWLGTALKWTATAGAAIVTLYGAWHALRHGDLPTKPPTL